MAQLVTGIDTAIDDFVTEVRAAASFAELRTGTAGVFARPAPDLCRPPADPRRPARPLGRAAGRLRPGDPRLRRGPGRRPTRRSSQALLTAERHLVDRQHHRRCPPSPTTSATTWSTGTKAAFVAERDALEGLATSEVTVGTLHDALEAERAGDRRLRPRAARPQRPTSPRSSLSPRTWPAGRLGLAAEMTARLDAVQARLDAQAIEADPRRRVDQLTEALRLMFGEDFPVVPGLRGARPAQGAEWRAAWGPGPAPSADDPRPPGGRRWAARFPVDDWFTGVARVREKLRSLEAVHPARRGVRHGRA